MLLLIQTYSSNNLYQIALGLYNKPQQNRNNAFLQLHPRHILGHNLRTRSSSNTTHSPPQPKQKQQQQQQHLSMATTTTTISVLPQLPTSPRSRNKIRPPNLLLHRRISRCNPHNKFHRLLPISQHPNKLLSARLSSYAPTPRSTNFHFSRTVQDGSVPTTED